MSNSSPSSGSDRGAFFPRNIPTSEADTESLRSNNFTPEEGFSQRSPPIRPMKRNRVISDSDSDDFEIFSPPKIRKRITIPFTDSDNSDMD